jgi:hypothetical protein
MISGVSGATSPLQTSVAAPKPAPSPQPLAAGVTLPGQAGAGIGDLQGVAQSAVGRGQIIDIAA